jgi:uncharacterized protein (TIGR03437 family)
MTSFSYCTLVRAALLVCATAIASLAQAQSISVPNASFEMATLPLNVGTGAFCNLIAGSTVFPTAGTLADWTATSTTVNAWAGAFAPILGSDNWNAQWWAGSNIGYIGIHSEGTVSLSQTLSATLENNVTYTLSALVGRPIDPGTLNYALQLWAGSTKLASASNLEALPSDSSGMDSVSYSSGANNPQAGQPLMIVLTSTGASNGLTYAYFNSVNLSSSSLGALPSIASGGVVSASAFGGFPSAAPGSWIEIYGSNLASDTRGWTSSDFSGVNAPTSLDGTSVTIGGQDAFIDYISPGQVNAQVPSSVGTGAQEVILTTNVGASVPYKVNVSATQPGLLAPPSFKINGTQYVVALFSDGAYVLPTGAISAVNSRPAQTGDTIILYGVGFGPVTPDIPAGQIVQQSNTLASSFEVSIGGMPATVNYAGLAPDYVGLYQFNIVVPNAAASGAVPLTFTLDGASGTQTLYIAVQN